MTESLDVNENSDVYYTGTYWNDFEIVRDWINTRISGDPKRKWHEHFARETRRSFHRALILNCGNGWIERELVDSGLIASGVGIDYSQSLLDEAAAAALRDGMPLTYQQANINTAAFPRGKFDLVVNHAAAHHIASIDRVFREVCRVLPDDGWFVNFDYVGPHRNQYRLDAWEEAWQLNQELPEALRQDLEYPPIPVMLVVDPTEAVHSELIVETYHRYFSEGQFTPLGGALAYPLLTHNARMFEAADDAERTRWIDRIMEADDDFLTRHPDSTLFAYFAGQPKKSVLHQTDVLRTWEAAEVERERRAHEHGGEYYERGLLATTLVAIDEQRALNSGVRERITQLQAELGAMRSRFLYSRARRVVDSTWVRGTRGKTTLPGAFGGPESSPAEQISRGKLVGDQIDTPVAANPSDKIRGALATAQIQRDAEEREHVRLSQQVEELRKEVASLESEFLYSTIQRLADARATHRIRDHRAIAALERRVRVALQRSA